MELAGVMTHFATADERQDGGFLQAQLAAFTEWALAVKAQHPQVVVHAANSAATMRDSDSHFDMVRCGISIYGMDPFGADPLEVQLEPALELSSYVAEVKRCGPGESAGYGRRFIASQPTNIGVIPIGYGDGWRRGLSGNARVLIDGASYPLVGTVSMDSVTVDLGGNQAGAAAAGRAGDPDRLERRAADHRRGARAAARDDQLRDHMRAHGAGPAQLPP